MGEQDVRTLFWRFEHDTDYPRWVPEDLQKSQFLVAKTHFYLFSGPEDYKE